MFVHLNTIKDNLENKQEIEEWEKKKEAEKERQRFKK